MYSFSKTALFAQILILVFSCGNKNIEGEDVRLTPSLTPEQLSYRVKDKLENDQIGCDERYCPQSLVRVSTVLDGNRSKECTGVLVSSTKVLMRLSCLPRNLRVSKIDCSEIIVSSFGNNRFSGKEALLKNAQCDTILTKDSAKSFSADLWNSDVAILKLKTRITSPVARIDYRGLNRFLDIQQWYMVNDHGQWFYKKYNCSVINKENYLNPFLSHKNRSFYNLKSCLQTQTGDILLSSSYRLLGIKSVDISSGILDNLESLGLVNLKDKRFSYATNIICAQDIMSPYGSSPGECFVKKSQGVLDFLRHSMLNSKKVHEKKMLELEKKLETKRDFFQWDFGFVKQSGSPRFESTPLKIKCISNIRKWIYKFKKNGRIKKWGRLYITKDHYLFSTKLDSKLMSYSHLGEKTLQKMYVEFNPKAAYFNGRADLKLFYDFNGQERISRFEQVQLCRSK